MILILAVACSSSPEVAVSGDAVLASPKDLEAVAEGVALTEVAMNYQVFELADTFDFTQTLLDANAATLMDISHCATQPGLADFDLFQSPGAEHGWWWGFEMQFADCDFGGWKFHGRIIYTYDELYYADDLSDSADVDAHLAAAISIAERGEQTTYYCMDLTLENDYGVQKCGVVEGDSRDHVNSFEGENDYEDSALAAFSWDGGASLSSSGDDWDIYRSGTFTMAGHLDLHGDDGFDFDAYSGEVSLDGVQKLTSDSLPYDGAITIDGFGSLVFDADTPSTGEVTAQDTDGNDVFTVDLDDYAAPEAP